MNTLNLQLPPNARTTDPESSHQAGEGIEASGNATTQRRIALEAVKRRPGYTAKELAVTCNIDRYMLSRRLPELRYKGLVVNGGMRKCATVGGKLSQTWRVA